MNMLATLPAGTRFRLYDVYKAGFNRRVPRYSFNGISLIGRVLTVVAQCPTYTAVTIEDQPGYIPMCPHTTIR